MRCSPIGTRRLAAKPLWPTDADVLAIVERLTAPVPRARRRPGKRAASKGLTQPTQQGTLDGVPGVEGGDAGGPHHMDDR